jgi:hypothetical protein
MALTAGVLKKVLIWIHVRTESRKAEKMSFVNPFSDPML